MKRLRFLLLATTTTLVMAGAVATWAQSGPSAPVQPLPFSHRVHAGSLQLACATCHPGSKSGERMMFAAPSACMECHAGVRTDSPSIQTLADYAKKGQPVPWVRIYQIPSFVRFNHTAHAKAGQTCQDCHGPVTQRDQLSRETDLTMVGCVTCHTDKSAPLDCQACHDIQQ